MDENENKKLYRPKRPKIRVKANSNNLDYYASMTEENIEFENRKNLKLNRDLGLNDDNNNEKIRKKSVQNRRTTKKSLTEFQKKIKQLIKKINSPSHKIKILFYHWASKTFKQKNNSNGDEDEEEEEEEEIEKEENEKETVKVYKMKKVKKIRDDNDFKNNHIDTEQEEEEDDDEEEEDDKMNIMNDLKINLEEIEERPPNEEESAMTSVATMGRNPKNQLNVALRKIFKYKNFFYCYFTKWKKVTSSPEIMIILKYQKKLKSLLMKLDGKRNNLKLAMAFKNWKMKCELLRLNDKKFKKKKKIIIYKKKNGEMEIKENIEDYKNLIINNTDDNLSIKKDGVKIKKVKKIVKKKVTTSKTKNLKNSNNIDNKKETFNNNITPIKDIYSSQDNIIYINKLESERSEVNSSMISDTKNENENDDSSIKHKKVVKKVKKVVKKVKKSKKDEKDEKNNNDIEKILDNNINKSKDDLSSLLISSDQIKRVKPLYNIEKNDEEKKDRKKISSSAKKSKKKTKKSKNLNKDDIDCKSTDLLLEKDNELSVNNLYKILSKSYYPNSEHIEKHKSSSIEGRGVKHRKISKKKIIEKPEILEKKIKNEIDDKENIEEIKNNNELTMDIPFKSSNEIGYKMEKVEDINNNIHIENENYESQKNFSTPKIKFKTDDDDSQKKAGPAIYHNIGKDSRLDLKAIASLDLIDFSEDTSDDDTKKMKKKKKNNKNKKKDEQNYKDEINPDIINIEITQDDDDSEDKRKSKRKKKKLTKEEKELIKIYKRAFHLLRKVIRSFKKRTKKKDEKYYNEEKNKYFNKWKNIFKNNFTKKNKYIEIENILGEKIEFNIEEKKKK